MSNEIASHQKKDIIARKTILRLVSLLKLKALDESPLLRVKGLVKILEIFSNLDWSAIQSSYSEGITPTTNVGDQKNTSGNMFKKKKETQVIDLEKESKNALNDITFILKPIKVCVKLGKIIFSAKEEVILVDLIQGLYFKRCLLS